MVGLRVFWPFLHALPGSSLDLLLNLVWKKEERLYSLWTGHRVGKHSQESSYFSAVVYFRLREVCVTASLCPEWTLYLSASNKGKVFAEVWGLVPRKSSGLTCKSACDTKTDVCFDPQHWIVNMEAGGVRAGSGAGAQTKAWCRRLRSALVVWTGVS